MQSENHETMRESCWKLGFHSTFKYTVNSYTTIKHDYLGRDVQSNFVFIFDNYLYMMREFGVVVPIPTTHLLRLLLTLIIIQIWWHLGGQVAPSTYPAQTKHFFVPKRTNNYASTSWVFATTEVVLTVHQPCIPVYIGNSTTTTASLIGKHMCTRLYYD